MSYIWTRNNWKLEYTLAGLKMEYRDARLLYSALQLAQTQTAKERDALKELRAILRTALDSASMPVLLPLKTLDLIEILCL